MKSKYFKIQELVSKQTYEKYGEKSWIFLDERLILTLDALREYFNAPITVNNWLWGGNLQQRGLRTNCDEIVKNKTLKNSLYVSQHCLGKAVDFNVKNHTVKDVYKVILENPKAFPYIKRIENINKTPTWVHIDIANTENENIIIFN